MELQFENITKYYGKQCALDHFNATLTSGVYGILGPNGSGKTTLIRILIGVLKANEGTVSFNGKSIQELGETYLDRIGYLPQYSSFYKNFRLDEFLKYMGVLKNIPKSFANQRVLETLEYVNLADLSKKYIGELSGGMKQRLGIAQAILNDPDILVLDEPTAGLDPVERIRFRNLISRLSENKLVLVATHIVSDIENIAKEILLLKNGQLVVQSSPENLIQKIDGKVWDIKINNEDMEEIIKKYPVGNIKQMKDGCQIRIVSESKPENKNIFPVEPTLEDVYLSVFNS